MNYKNTTEKGNSFEKQVFYIVKDMLDNDDFYVSGKKSKIYWKKSYYSHKRQGEIEVDISVETFLENADSYSILTIIECKNYNSNVPINDIREFDSILNEIGEHNTKGIIMSNSSFQKGTINYAKTSRIGLGRINSKNKVDWINYRKNRRIRSFEISNIETNLYGGNLVESNFFAFYDNKGFDKFPDLLIDFGIIDKYSNKLKYITIPYISEKQIKKKIQEFPFQLIYDRENKLNAENLCVYLKDKYKIKFSFDDILFDDILGKIHFEPLEIHINQSLKSNIYRWRFTLAHEIGHLVLHQSLLCKYFDEKIESENTLSLNQSDLLSNNKWLEIQANIFASILLLPYNQLIIHVADYFKRENIYKGYLHLDNQPNNRIRVIRILRELQARFGVSTEVAKYRLIGLDLLKDTTDTSIEGILRNRI